MTIFGIMMIATVVLVFSLKKTDKTTNKKDNNEKQDESNFDASLKATRCPKQFTLVNKVSDKKDGQNTFLEVFGTHCGPCRAQVPHIKKLQEEYKNFYFVSITSDTKENCQEFLNQNLQAKFLNVGYDENHTVGQLMQQFQQSGVPHCFIFNKKDQLVWHGHPGQSDAIVKQLNGSNNAWADTKGHVL